MEYISHYNSPLGDILIVDDDIGLTGLWFEGQKYFGKHFDEEHEEKDTMNTANRNHIKGMAQYL